MCNREIAGAKVLAMPIVKKRERHTDRLWQVPTAVMQGDELHAPGEALVLDTTTFYLGHG